MVEILVTDPYDTWQATEDALKAAGKLLDLLNEQRESKTCTKDEKKLLERELIEARKWVRMIGQRRFDLVDRKVPMK